MAKTTWTGLINEYGAVLLVGGLIIGGLLKLTLKATRHIAFKKLKPIPCAGGKATINGKKFQRTDFYTKRGRLYYNSIQGVPCYFVIENGCFVEFALYRGNRKIMEPREVIYK